MIRILHEEPGEGETGLRTWKSGRDGQPPRLVLRAKTAAEPRSVGQGRACLTLAGLPRPGGVAVAIETCRIVRPGPAGLRPASSTRLRRARPCPTVFTCPQPKSSDGPEAPSAPSDTEKVGSGLAKQTNAGFVCILEGSSHLPAGQRSAQVEVQAAAAIEYRVFDEDTVH
jgi:hypothetical protein